MNSDPRPMPDGKSVHGHTGPTTPAEDKMRDAGPEAAPPGDKAKIAEAASREEDA
ncbi:MAG: hypothetical protein KAX56_09745 [Phenylobacterium sp.]|nr:hypothetical protein [Phenylobacterium sp.]